MKTKARNWKLEQRQETYTGNIPYYTGQTRGLKYTD